MKSTALLEGRVALVSGASRGIGAAIARAFGRHGAAVAVNYRSNDSAAETVVNDIEKSGARGLAVAADAGDEDQVAAMVEQVTEELGDIDTLVCNAAGGTEEIVERYLAGGSLLDGAKIIRERVITQLDSTIYTCRHVVPGMRRRGGGSIVLIGATGTRRSPARGIAETIVAKAAQDAVGRLLAAELGPDDIRVNTVAPGVVPTDANAGEHQQAMIEAASAQSPLGRVTHAENVADAAVALSAGLTRNTTGAYLPVDGGATMG